MDISLFNRFSQAKILIVGDIMLDRYFIGDSQRISPEAPVPVVKIGEQVDRLGGAANVARNIRHLDAQAGLIGIVGNDDNGLRIEQQLKQEGINGHLIKSNKPTITKLRVISRKQQVVRLDFETPFDKTDGDILSEIIKTELPNYDVVIFSDYAKGTLSDIASLIAQCKKAGKIVMVDPKQSDLSHYRDADVITPNMSEFIAAGGVSKDEIALTESAIKLLNTSGIKSMLLTRSEKGMSAISSEGKTDFPAKVREVSDVTGAGDTVIATLAIMMGLGQSLCASAEIANIAAGIVVGKLGAEVVTPEELAYAVNQSWFAKGSHYQCPFDQVLSRVQLSKRAGEKIVFTNGCFDILHAGHVSYLEKAKSMGDRLVVGLNTDDSIRRLKGAHRPINPLDQRATLLTALKAVDWVIPFGSELNDTPIELIELIQPDVLVKGSDYTLDTIVGAKETLARGGKVETIEFVNGCSTTQTIKKIRELL